MENRYSDLVSIIVPIYNVEKYLCRCIDSIIRQTYQKIEIILVDDGSTDKSGIIADKYARMDNRIRVFHKKNGGLSDARNYGIDKAVGEYVMFVDSDDYIDMDMVKILLDNLKNSGADISMSAFYWIYDNEQIIPYKRYGDYTLYESDNKWEMLFTNETTMVVAWNKLYKTDIFDNIRYKVGVLHEDEEIIHKILDRANRICYTDSKLYYYVKRADSIVSAYSLKRFNDAENAFYNRMMFFDKKKLNLYHKYTMNLYMHYILNHINMIPDNELNNKFRNKYRIKCLKIMIYRLNILFLRYDRACYQRVKQFVLFGKV